MKRIGTREEVYLGLALKTPGGMTRTDIIKATKQNAKKKYLSRKISTRMKTNSPLIKYKKIRSSKKQQLIDSDISQEKKEKYMNERRQARLLRRKKSQRVKLQQYNKSPLNSNKPKSSKKLSFNFNNNVTKEYHCQNLEDNYELGYDSDDENENSSNTFKIEEMPDIDIDEYLR